MFRQPEIEAAIKLLQQAGYDVFQQTARARLRAVDSIDLAYYATVKDEPGWQHYQSQRLTRLIAQELVKAECIAFTTDADLNDPPLVWAGQGRQNCRAGLLPGGPEGVATYLTRCA